MSNFSSYSTFFISTIFGIKSYVSKEDFSGLKHSKQEKT